MLLVIWLAGILEMTPPPLSWKGRNKHKRRGEMVCMGGLKYFFVQKESQAEKEGSYVCTCVFTCLLRTPAWLEYVSAYVTKNNSCHGNIAVKGTGIFLSQSLFFLLIEYNTTPRQHTQTEVYFCFYFDYFFPASSLVSQLLFFLSLYVFFQGRMYKIPLNSIQCFPHSSQGANRYNKTIKGRNV